MKIILKGGVWKNTEDEILKAAVMKYGKNQWARISSLLTRKSPKQCKARWYEWLDPSIKKTQWSKEEDEKLLHLAKLMPTQWRTIAPIVGRTPNQCLERYQKLLDEAELRESGAGSSSSGAAIDSEGNHVTTAEDIRKLRPGEIDPNPESKPAKPDAIDMDEDEMEMLSEARARLANTQGKKAKRKARERQLEDARRLAANLKRKELKAAGIDYRYRHSRREFDYNAEIRYQKHAPAGFYDVSEEKEMVVKKNFEGMLVTDLEPKTRNKQEEEERAKRAEKKKAQEEKGVFKIPDIPKLQEEQRILKRRKLNMSSPQIGEQELEELVKMSHSSSMIRAAVDDGSVDASSELISDYESTISSRIAESTAQLPMRTPVAADIVGAEATNLLRLQNTQTPLLGGENTSLSAIGTGFSGITPQRSIVQTPNPVVNRELTPSVHQRDKFSETGSSVGASSWRTATPLRDDLKINSEPSRDIFQEELMMKAKMTLDDAFASLPKPKNDYEIVVPELDEDDEQDDKDTQDEQKVEDQSDLLQKKHQEEIEAEAKKMEARSSAVKRDLPRPRTIDSLSQYRDHYGSSEIDRMIAEEVCVLIQRDNVEHPVSVITERGQQQQIKSRKFEEIDLDLLNKARSLIEEEAAQSSEINKSFLGNVEEVVLIKDSKNNLKYVPADKAKKAQVLRARDEIATILISELQSKVQQLEGTIEVELQSYTKRSKSLKQSLHTSYAEYLESLIELEAFRNLKETESGVNIKERVAKMEKELRHVEQLEMEEQLKYKSLVERLNYTAENATLS